MQKAKEVAKAPEHAAPIQKMEAQQKPDEKKLGRVQLARSQSAAAIPPPDGGSSLARAGAMAGIQSSGLGNSSRAGMANTLQRQAGNARLGRMAGTVQRKIAETGSRNHPRIQFQLMVNPPGDAAEKEAYRLSEQITRDPDRSITRSRGADSLQRTKVMEKPSQESANAEVPVTDEIENQINNARRNGKPLESVVQRKLEVGLNADFSQVRIHDDEQSAETAKALNARAFTTHQDIFFGKGEYQPGNSDGQKLLAHELTHSIQQDGSPPRIQRQPNQKPNPNLSFRYKVHVDRVLDSEQLLLEFIKQYRGIATDEEAKALREKENWNWVGSPPTVKQTHVDSGYILISVNVSSIKPITQAEKKERRKYFKELPQGEQAAINAEVDRQFWESTEYQVGQKLGTSSNDKQMAEYWKMLRNELLKKRQAIDVLPPDIRAFLFDLEAPALAPKDFEAVLRIASKVSALTPMELAEYKSRVTARTTDWSAYEASIDRFIAERKERETTGEERRKIETRFYRLDALYDRYRSYLSLLKNSARLSGMGAYNPRALGGSIGMQPKLNDMRKELDADLVKAGFLGGITDFEKLIGDYENVFERETLAIARVMLDQYEHILLQEEQRYQQASLAGELPEAARLSHQIRGLSLRACFELSKNAKSIIHRHPLMSNEDLEVENIARASASEAQSMMFNYISARRKDIAETRTNLANKPTMIYGLDKLLEASFRIHNLQSGTIYDKIIRNHISDVNWTEAIPKLILAVIAVAAGLLTGGGGTAAVLAGGTALGIGAYQAIQEFQQYERMSAAHGAGLLTEDPSFAWVVVAVIGAGFDAAVLVSALTKVSGLRSAIKAFNEGAEAGDVAKLTQKLEKLNEVEEGIRKSIIRAAADEKKAQAAWKAVLQPSGLRAVPSLTALAAERFGLLVYAVYRSFKSGIREFQVFLKSREAIDLIGDITKLPAEDLAVLKTGYLKAIEEMKAVAAHGKGLKMADEEVDAFMTLRANTKGMTLQQVIEGMEAWRNTQGIAWKGFSKGKLAEHFVKHGAEFKGLTQPQYLKASKEFASAVGDFKVQQVGNFLVKYDPVTRRTLIAHIADREIRSFYIADLRDADPFQAAVDLAKELSKP
jgi:hypothetical protein